MKDILGQEGLKWDITRKQGAYSGGVVDHGASAGARDKGRVQRHGVDMRRSGNAQNMQQQTGQQSWPGSGAGAGPHPPSPTGLPMPSPYLASPSPVGSPARSSHGGLAKNAQPRQQHSWSGPGAGACSPSPYLASPLGSDPGSPAKARSSHGGLANVGRQSFASYTSTLG